MIWDFPGSRSAEARLAARDSLRRLGLLDYLLGLHGK
jgi:hypothetical protein